MAKLHRSQGAFSFPCFHAFKLERLRDFRLNRAGNSCPIPVRDFCPDYRSSLIPEKREFSVLNDEDHSKNLVVHSQDVGRKFNGRGAMNRY